MDEMTLRKALSTLELFSNLVQEAMKIQKPRFGNAEVFAGREEVKAIDEIKRYFAEHMEELED